MMFIVDNSGSMEEEQDLLARNFGQFIRQFVQKQIDFRIGILSTDVYDRNRGRLISRSSSEKWLTPSSSNLESKFRNAINLGTGGADSEQGINSLLMGVSPSILGVGGYNEGFVRDDALFSAIFVSDEDEDIRETDASPEARIDRLASRMVALKGPKSRGYRFDFVVDLDEPKPRGTIRYPLPEGDITSYPNVYLKAAERFSSKTININNDFGRDLVDIGSDIIRQAQSEFKLSKLAFAGTVEVTMNGVKLFENGADGFVFHADRNTIELQGTALKNSPGSNLVIRYRLK